jgi:hypothetical protein
MKGLSRQIAMACTTVLALSGEVSAQVTGSTTTSPTTAEGTARIDVPPSGSCMPIGLTTSGEMVFPIQCKEFIEQYKALDQKPAVRDEDKPISKQSVSKQSELPQNASTRPDVAPANRPLAKPAEREAREGAPGCRQFRSYDPATATYTTYDGKRHPCR